MGKYPIASNPYLELCISLLVLEKKIFYHIWACWPSWSCDQNNLYKSWLTYCKESSYEIWVQLAEWFLRKLCSNILMGLQYERLGWKVKGQAWSFELIISHCHIWLNISSENNDFGFNSFHKISFSKISPFKCIWKQIWPGVKYNQGQPRIIIWTNLVGLSSLMLHTKSQGHRPSGSGEDF